MLSNLHIHFSDDIVCKDFLQIVDIGNKHILFQNCTEMATPLEILSESSEIQVIFSIKGWRICLILTYIYSRSP